MNKVKRKCELWSKEDFSRLTAMCKNPKAQGFNRGWSVCIYATGLVAAVPTP